MPCTHMNSRTKKAPILNRTKARLTFINHLNILSYAFPVTGESRQSLLGPASNCAPPFEICNSEVIFRYNLLVPGFHHPRFSLSFRYNLLSSSTFFINMRFYYKQKTLDSSRVFALSSAIFLCFSSFINTLS